LYIDFVREIELHSHMANQSPLPGLFGALSDPTRFAVVEQLARSGLASPEIERRAHLIRIKARQDIVPPSAKLTETGPGNRNAALWRQSGLARWAGRS
jgi:hypothetical protein